MIEIEDIYLDPQTHDVIYEDNTLKTTTNNVGQALGHLIATLQGEQILAPDTGTRWLDFQTKGFVDNNFVNAVNTSLKQDDRFKNIKNIEFGYNKRERKQYVDMSVETTVGGAKVYTLLG